MTHVSLCDFTPTYSHAHVLARTQHTKQDRYMAPIIAARELTGEAADRFAEPRDGLSVALDIEFASDQDLKSVSKMTPRGSSVGGGQNI